MRKLARHGGVVTQLLWVQFIYLNMALFMLPAVHQQDISCATAHSIVVDLEEQVDTDSGFTAHGHYLLKRPVIPEDKIIMAIIPVIVIFCTICIYLYSIKLLREAQRRIHAPPSYMRA